MKKPSAGTISSFITALIFGSLFYYIFGVWGFVAISTLFAAFILYIVWSMTFKELDFHDSGPSGYDAELDASLRDGGWDLFWSYDDNDYHNLAEIYSSKLSSSYRLILSDTIPDPRSVQFDGFYESLEDAKEAAQGFIDTYACDE